MIGSNGQNGKKRPIIVALEDALVTGLAAGMGAVVAVGYPPTIEVGYSALIIGILAGVLSWAKCRNVEVK